MLAYSFGGWTHKINSTDSWSVPGRLSDGLNLQTIVYRTLTGQLFIQGDHTFQSVRLIIFYITELLFHFLIVFNSPTPLPDPIQFHYAFHPLLLICNVSLFLSMLHFYGTSFPFTFYDCPIQTALCHFLFA